MAQLSRVFETLLEGSSLVLTPTCNSSFRGSAALQSAKVPPCLYLHVHRNKKRKIDNVV